MSNITVTVLWIYIVLLLAGGVMGLVKAGSKISLITSAVFALLLALCATAVIRPFYFADILVGLLLVVFGIRFAKGRKFMPSGMMLGLSLVVLAVLLLAR
ncbi:MAG: TMEM14 family protein [Verrucomicrobiota bacterium]